MEISVKNKIYGKSIENTTTMCFDNHMPSLREKGGGGRLDIEPPTGHCLSGDVWLGGRKRMIERPYEATKRLRGGGRRGAAPTFGGGGGACLRSSSPSGVNIARRPFCSAMEARWSLRCAQKAITSRPQIWMTKNSVSMTSAPTTAFVLTYADGATLPMTAMSVNVEGGAPFLHKS